MGWVDYISIWGHRGVVCVGVAKQWRCQVGAGGAVRTRVTPSQESQKFLFCFSV